MSMDFNDFSVDISAFQAKWVSKWASDFRGAGAVLGGVSVSWLVVVVVVVLIGWGMACYLVVWVC